MTEPIGPSQPASVEGTPRPVLPVEGAFEVWQGATEHLNTLTRTGELTHDGDTLPQIRGVDLSGRTLVIAVNDPNTDFCQAQIRELEAFHVKNPDVPIITLTMREFDDKNKDFGESLTQPVAVIDRDAAIDWGLAIDPTEDAAPDAWEGTLRRTAAVVEPTEGGLKVVHIEQIPDQEQIPSLATAASFTTQNSS
jgi:hypothetical protein